MVCKILFLIILSSACFNVVITKSCGREGSDADVDIISTTVSPDKEIVATVYYISGGGAAGYVYRLVNLRRRGGTFNPRKGIVFQVTRSENIMVTWEDDSHLAIKYSKPSSLLTQVKEWDAGKRKVHISYAEE